VIGERLLRNKKSWSDSGGYQALGQPSRRILKVELKAGRNASSRSNGTNLGERLQKKETDQMISSKRFSLALAALVLVVLAGAGSAFAQTVTFDMRTAPTFVANTGVSEVLGQVTLSAESTCGTDADAFCISTAGTIQILYVGTDIDNDLATADINTVDTNGIEVCEVTDLVVDAAVLLVTTCNTSAVGGYLSGTFSVNNTSAGGVVSFGVRVGVNFSAGEQIIVRGVRGKIVEGPGSVEGTAVIGQLTSSPSTIAAFNPTSEVVARSADPLEVDVDDDTLIQCNPDAEITITITEGFNTAFVDHEIVEADDDDVTNDVRPLFGGRNNSHIFIVISDMPDGWEFAWPLEVEELDGDTPAHLYLVDQSNNGDEAEYLFATEEQDDSDNEAEDFEITLEAPAGADVDPGEIGLSGTPDDFGTATAQAQMFPPDTEDGEDDDENNADEDRPRYDHDLENDPGDDFLTVAPCTTNLLFPWVANFAGLDTGLAISNTSDDPYNTEPQTGTCEVNLYPTDTTTNNGVALTGPATITTSSIAPGSVWRSTLSGQTAFRGKAGYIIAICEFQYGHGFAFFTDNFGVGSPATAQGYLALIIPDPEITQCDDNDRAATSGTDDTDDHCIAPAGEGLGQ
jgi:hypothetical protein